jgi:hypothetical protein
MKFGCCSKVYSSILSPWFLQRDEGGSKLLRSSNKLLINDFIINTATEIKNVVASAAESEVGEAFISAPIRVTLFEAGKKTSNTVTH